ncbi:MAG: hypothetical protein NTW25_08480 [Candidatus Kapabacteria bacterium]|nr:hypothetical protein [Candidatus Kapabacteria bacterium]
MKTYNYKDFISTYLMYSQYKGVEYFAYYERKYKAFYKLYNIDFENKIELKNKRDDFEYEIIKEYFDKSIQKCYRKNSPFAGLMEASGKVVEFYKKTTDKFQEADSMYSDAHFELLCEAFNLLYGKTELEFTSNNLLAFGFNDSDEIPDEFDNLY